MAHREQRQQQQKAEARQRVEGMSVSSVGTDVFFSLFFFQGPSTTALHYYYYYRYSLTLCVRIICLSHGGLNLPNLVKEKTKRPI